MQVILSAMPGAGNFGDDLISLMLVESLIKQFPLIRVGVIAYSDIDENLYSKFGKRVSILKRPQITSGKVLGRMLQIIRFIRRSDVYIVGGGGLFQDTHFRYTVHKYLTYLKFKPSIIKITIGLGVGPIRFNETRSYLNRVLELFSFLEVRDNYSKDLLFELNDRVHGKVKVSDDIVVSRDFSKALCQNHNEENKYLGCSIRRWSGLDKNNASSFISRVMEYYSIDICKIFVFEYINKNNEELNFANEISEVLRSNGFTTDIICYGTVSLGDFIEEMKSVNYAIATRFHANLVWQKFGVPVIPIVYAPKVRSFYSERGLRSLEIDEIKEITITEDLFQCVKFERPKDLPDLEKIEPVPVSFSLFSFLCAYDIRNFFWRAKRKIRKSVNG